MRVLHVISGIDPSQGGTATALVALAAAQQRAGLDVSIATSFLGQPGNAAAPLRAMGIDVTEIGPCTQPLQRHPEMGRILRQEIAKVQIVHIHAMWEEIQHRGARICREMNVPYLMTPHGMIDPWSLRQSALKKKLYMMLRMRSNLNQAAAIHYTSSIECELAKPLRLRARALVVPNGVDLKEFVDLPIRGAFRARHPEIGNRPMVLFLGRVHPKKGFDLLMPAFARAQLSDAVLVVAGPEQGGYGATVRELAASNGIADRVFMVGMLRGRERIEAMVDADLFVLPSYQENFGIAVIEALSAGCPVLISDQVNIHNEILAAGVGGVVPTKMEPLSAELRRWMEDSSLRSRAAAAGPEFVRRNYDWDVIARQWADIYPQLAGKHAAAKPQGLL